MNKIAFSLFSLVILVLASLGASAQACFPPTPIFGKVDWYGNSLSGHPIEISVTNYDGTVSTINTATNSNSEYSEDLANLEGCYYTAKTIVVKACSGTGCEITKNAPKGTPLRVDFIFKESGTPSVSGNTVTVVQPKPQPEVVPVDDGLSNLEVGLVTLLATLIGVFAWGKGFAGLIKYYLRRAKEERAKGNKELANQLESRAKKMAETTITNFLAGKYKQ